MRALLGYMVVLVLISFSQPALSQSGEQPPMIEVYGEAEVLLEPDYIEWVVVIRTNDKVPRLAREVNDALLKSVKEIAGKADIDEEDMVWGEPTYEQLFDADYDSGEKADFNDYTGTEVTRRVTMVMREMDELQEMLDAVHPLGVFYAVRRKSTKYEEAAKEVELTALKAARARAVEQAAALGQKVGKAISVDVFVDDGEGDRGGLFGPPAKPIEDDDEASGPNGKVRVVAYADVIFRIE